MAVTVQVHYATLQTKKKTGFAWLRTVLRPIARVPYFAWRRTVVPPHPSSASVSVHWADMVLPVGQGFVQVHYALFQTPTTFVSAAQVQVTYAALDIPRLSQGYFNVYKLNSGVWVSTTTYAVEGGVWL